MANNKLADLIETFYEIADEMKREASGKSTKSADVLKSLTAKYGQAVAPAAPVSAPAKPDLTNAINQVLRPYGYSVLEGTKAEPLSGQFVDVKIKSVPGQSRWSGQGVTEKDTLQNLINPVSMEIANLPARPLVYT